MYGFSAKSTIAPGIEHPWIINEIRTIRIQIGKNYRDLETCRKSQKREDSMFDLELAKMPVGEADGSEIL